MRLFILKKDIILIETIEAGIQVLEVLNNNEATIYLTFNGINDFKKINRDFLEKLKNLLKIY